MEMGGGENNLKSYSCINSGISLISGGSMEFMIFDSERFV